MVIVCSRDFDINQIANSGQCFRINQISPATWEVIAFSRRLLIEQKKENFSAQNEEVIHSDYNDFSNLSTSVAHIFHCSQADYGSIWAPYFDMSRDYSLIKSKIRGTNDTYLTHAINFGYGIRILQQDPWETLISFIISQRNNISRIRRIIKELCAPYGLRFPSPKELAKYSVKDFENIGLGYRARYVRNAAIVVASSSLNLEALKEMSYADALNQLKKQDGIGDKVANCIALFGLQKLEAFPIDIWIMKILEREYGASAKNKLGTFNPDYFDGYAGIVQQYMFYYERSLGSL